jgi:hypothetical protein
VLTTAGLLLIIYRMINKSWHDAVTQVKVKLIER